MFAITIGHNKLYYNVWYLATNVSFMKTNQDNLVSIFKGYSLNYYRLMTVAAATRESKILHQTELQTQLYNWYNYIFSKS